MPSEWRDGRKPRPRRNNVAAITPGLRYGELAYRVTWRQRVDTDRKEIRRKEHRWCATRAEAEQLQAAIAATGKPDKEG